MLSVNPGSENTNDYGFEQAYNNILVYINDCEIELYIQSANCIPEDNGRYLFTLKSPLSYKLTYEIEMPSLPLNEIRYMQEEGQNIWNYPRLYVNGSSWVWTYGLITREGAIRTLESEIDEWESSIKESKDLIERLRNK
ncbi:hypothetical protein D3C73_278460 [compost metagenome]